MIGRNLNDVQVIHRALIFRRLALEQRKRLPRGQSIADLIDERDRLRSLEEDCSSAVRALEAPKLDTTGGVA